MRTMRSDTAGSSRLRCFQRMRVRRLTCNSRRHGWLPPSVLARAEIPDGVSIRVVSPTELPTHWRDPDPPQSLRDLGRDWLRCGEAACLKVPSAIVPEEWNYLLNPQHPDFGKLIFGVAEEFHFDRRLARGRKRDV